MSNIQAILPTQPESQYYDEPSHWSYSTEISILTFARNLYNHLSNASQTDSDWTTEDALLHARLEALREAYLRRLEMEDEVAERQWEMEDLCDDFFREYPGGAVEDELLAIRRRADALAGALGMEDGARRKLDMLLEGVGVRGARGVRLAVDDDDAPKEVL